MLSEQIYTLRRKSSTAIAKFRRYFLCVMSTKPPDLIPPMELDIIMSAEQSGKRSVPAVIAAQFYKSR